MEAFEGASFLGRGSARPPRDSRPERYRDSGDLNRIRLPNIGSLCERDGVDCDRRPRLCEWGLRGLGDCSPLAGKRAAYD